MGFAPAPRTFGVNGRTVCFNYDAQQVAAAIDDSSLKAEFDKLEKEITERIDEKAAEMMKVIETTGTEQ